MSQLNASSQWRVVYPTATLLWVDTVAGNDGNDGLSSGTALKTIQAASDKFFPSVTPARKIARGSTLTIRLKYTAAMPPITETVYFPPRTGDGILILEGEEEVLATVTFSSFTPIAAFECRQTLAVTGTLSAAYNDASFIKVVTPSGDAVAQSYEQLPVVTASGSSAAVTVLDPGVQTAFDYTGSAALQQVRPQIVWECGSDSTAYGYSASQPNVVNGGGALVVRGFHIKPIDGTAQAYAKFLYSNTPKNDSLASTTNVQRCIFESNSTDSLGFGSIISGGSGFGGVIGLASAGDVIDCQGLWANVRWKMTSAVTDFFGVYDAQIYFYGLDMVADSGDGRLYLNSNVTGFDSFMDLRGGHVMVGAFSQLSFYALTVEGSTNANGCVQVGARTNFGGGQHATANMITGSRVRGSSGNSDVGARVKSFGLLLSVTGTPTLSGAGGNIAVGSLAAQTWGAGNSTDTTRLSSYRTGSE